MSLVSDAFGELTPGRRLAPQQALFVCTRNSARSQLAAALWRSIAGSPAESAGTHPAVAVHPGAIAAATRAGLDIASARPRLLSEITEVPPLVITVCDQAHEEVTPDSNWLHWSIADPVRSGTKRSFDRAVADLRTRIVALVSETASAT